MLRAVEFFSGIGAFSYAARKHSVEVIAAFDQNQSANETFEHNFGLRPSNKNLDSIKSVDIPTADLWWMSPPCTPYSIRGKRLDLQDSRGKAFLNLLAHLPLLKPNVVLIENVAGFLDSEALKEFTKVAEISGYRVQLRELCSTDFGTPMRRPRIFVLASKEQIPLSAVGAVSVKPSQLGSFLEEDHDELILSHLEVSKYGDGFDVVEIDDLTDQLTCFTRNYARCMKASGSLLKLKSGQLRRFSPNEILRLLGFQQDFTFPDHLTLQTRWKLAGNSVDVRAIDQFVQAVAVAAGSPV